jgi:hypothetical protein
MLSSVQAATIYVSATATDKGDGSQKHPFSSLKEVEAASEPGDTIIVVPSPIGVPPLDGGIALKSGQRLIGGGPRSLTRTEGAAAPRISNTSGQHLSGDAVRLADNTEVQNLTILNTFRGAIYGSDVLAAKVHDNDISAMNTSCTDGLLIYSSSKERVALKNAWAAIMVDADGGTASVSIRNNYVHDGECGDGIDIRASGSAIVMAHVDRNQVTRLEQGPSVGSVLAIGMQTRDSATLIVGSDDNAESYIGNMFARPAVDSSKSVTRGPSNPWPAGDLDGADCEGVFSNQTGGNLIWNINRNAFSHGIGGTSCNGAEFFVSYGNPTLSASIHDSTFEDNPGDMIEENNLGTGSFMSVTLDGVRVRHTTHLRPLPQPTLIPERAITSFTSQSFCVSQNPFGAHSVTVLRIVDSSFRDCASDAINSSHATLPDLFGSGSEAAVAPGAALVSIDMENSTIADVRGYAVHFVNYGPMDGLLVKLEGNYLETGHGDALVGIAQAQGATTKAASVDLGGGQMDSAGYNCFASEPNLAVVAVRYDISAKNNWWGDIGGTAPQSAKELHANIASLPVMPLPAAACRMGPSLPMSHSAASGSAGMGVN